ncbi:FAD-binding protein [Actinobacteria bacterium YIM 96077]|uniref:FAD-binding oxidoreductase n=1 Tax=Phytoactinopolyspora halophila TaxID=1981511 RepID=A0A329QTE4_9ACTN|nr:FAD-linked oxidase C-terminal domain-containing protein [Phytoactinopolyspora halophila]AYY13881.1 FAD-binding protein [Actinobacteria bacterium YIM 96077]RAW15577.1 FAD-binding oxidoreductase [Phytoactinopolyspora halophila]
MVKSELQRDLLDILGADGLVTEWAQRRTYEADGLAAYRSVPALVALPSSADDVAAVMRACVRHGVPVVPRGAGTGLSAGALPHPEGVLIVMSRMHRILDIDPVNQRIVVEPGVTNAAISRAVSEHDLYYAPDPSSQIVCSIGGNLAENSGGAHCLKYGFTTHHVLGCELVLPDGETVELGSSTLDPPGYDLRGVLVGSEGTLGVVTKITLRLLRRPEAVRTLVADFESPAAAGVAVSAIVAAGIVPAAVEMMDNLAIQACEEDAAAGFDVSSGAALIVELDGPAAECDAAFAETVALCQESGSTAIRVADDPQERALVWKGRKAAFAAMGRLAPDYFVQDGVIPRTRLGECLARIAEMAAEADLRVANVFHAGDGNLHPLVLYDSANPGEGERAESLSARIAELCVEFGGSLSGEHGIGVDKACSMPTMFGADDLAVMDRVRAAFDPAGRCNPDKVLPTPRLCGEKPGPYRPHPLEAAGVIERL